VLVVDDPGCPSGRVVVVVVDALPETTTSCGTPHAVATRARVSEKRVARRTVR
jgi:hypothetical protein